MNKNKQEYRTSDLWLSAYLICHGIKFDYLLSDKEDPGEVVFCLSGNREIREMVQEYRNNREVPAVDYKKTILDLILLRSNKLLGRWEARY